MDSNTFLALFLFFVMALCVLICQRAMSPATRSVVNDAEQPLAQSVSTVNQPLKSTPPDVEAQLQNNDNNNSDEEDSPDEEGLEEKALEAIKMRPSESMWMARIGRDAHGRPCAVPMEFGADRMTM